MRRADEENPLHRALHVDPCLTDAFTMFDEMASATMHTSSRSIQNTRGLDGRSWPFIAIIVRNR